MRIVADTNTVVSGLLWSGPPQQLINAARAKRITLYSSVALNAEFACERDAVGAGGRLQESERVFRIDDPLSISHIGHGLFFDQIPLGTL